MARQIIIHTCPYSIKNEHKCQDFKFDVSDTEKQFGCKYVDCDTIEDGCNHPDPKELFGYNLTDEEVQDCIDRK